MHWLPLLVLLSHPVELGAKDVVVAMTVPVGDEKMADVGIAIGVFCDDPAIVSADMRTTSQNTNVVVFRGTREGKTMCRVGTDFSRITYLFEITVVPKPARR